MKSLFVSALATTLCWAAPAKAQGPVCVAVDEPRDQLSAEQRTAAQQLFENELMVSEAKVADCPHPYLLSHVLLGGAVHILLRTEGHSYTATTDSLATISGAYAALIRDSQHKASPQTLELQPLREAGAGTKLASSDEEKSESAIGWESVPKERESTTSSFYARVGYAISPAIREQSQSQQGPTFGLGYRRNYRRWIFDASVANIFMDKDRTDDYREEDISVPTLLRLSGSYKVSSMASGAFYLGGGAGVGESRVRYSYRDPISPGGSRSSTESDYGLQGEFVAGWELASSSALRLFVEVNLTLPFSTVLVVEQYDSVSLDDQERFWAPSSSLSAGLGF